MLDPELETYEKRLRDVLEPAALDFSAILARLSVLFEDLRIEEYGSRLDGLDQPTTQARDTARSTSSAARLPRSLSSLARSKCSISGPNFGN